MSSTDTATWLLAPVTLRESVDLAIVDSHGLPAVSPATARWLRYAVNRLVRFLAADRAINQVTPQMVSAWVQFESTRRTRRGRFPSPAGVNSNLRAIKTLYSRLQLNNWIDDNPARPVRPLPEPALDPRAISEDDYLAMRAVAGGTRNRAILDVLWASGCRLGGLLSMRIDRMERFEAGGWPGYAFLVTEKGNKMRYVYVGRDRLQSDGLSEWLADRPDCSWPWLWLSLVSRFGVQPTPAGRMAASSVQGVVRRCRLRAGIPPERPASVHGFRHAFALRMLDEGVDLPAVSDWLGHSSDAFTAEVYSRRSERQLRGKYFHKLPPT